MANEETPLRCNNIVHNLGKINLNADALPRHPVEFIHAITFDTQSWIVDNTGLKNLCHKHLREVFVGANESAIANSEMDGLDSSNEELVAAVFLTRGKIGGEKCEIDDDKYYAAQNPEAFHILIYVLASAVYYAYFVLVRNYILLVKEEKFTLPNIQLSSSLRR